MARPDQAIGDALFAAGVITAEQLASARARAEGDPPLHIAAALAELGFADAETILGALDRAWDDDPSGDAALARALVRGGHCSEPQVDAVRAEVDERAQDGRAGRFCSLLALQGLCTSEQIEAARESAAQRVAAGAKVLPDDDLRLDLNTPMSEFIGDDDGGGSDADRSDADADAAVEADAADLPDLDVDDGDLPDLDDGGADAVDLDARLAERDSGFERFEPTPAGEPGDAPLPTHAGGMPATLAGSGPPPTHAAFGADAPTIGAGGAPPTLGSGPPPTLFGQQAAPEPDPGIAQDIPGYVLIRAVSRGVSGTTYEAAREADGLRVSLKRLSEDWAADAGFVGKVRTAAEAARDLLHDNIARVVEIHLPEDAAPDTPMWVAAEWTDGETIADLLRRARMPVDRVARIGIQAGRALHQAHERGVVHGRVRPECLVLDMGDRAVVTGIGMPAIAGVGRAPMGPSGGGATFSSYAPREAAAGPGAMDRRSDVYALGATLYEMMTGQPPFPPASAKELQRRSKGDVPASPRKLNPRVPPQAEAILLQALCHEPNRRYATAQAMAEDLERFRRGERVRARGASWFGQHRAATAGLVAAAVAVIAVPVYFLGFAGPAEDPGVSPAPVTDQPGGAGTGVLPPTKVAADLGEVRRDLLDGRDDEAARKIRDLLAAVGGKATREARILACRAYRRIGDLAAAERELASVAAVDGTAPGADVVAEEGLLALAEGRDAAALELLDRALQMSTESEVADLARRGKGQALLRLDRAGEARAALEEAGDRPETLALLAEAQLRAGDPDAAVETARRAATAQTAPPAAHWAYGAALEAQLKPEEARRRYRQATAGALSRDRRGEIALARLNDELDRINGAAPKELTAITQEIRAGTLTAEKAEELWKRCTEILDRTYSEATALGLRNWRMQLGASLGKTAEAMADADALLSPRAALDPSAQGPAFQVRARLRFQEGDFGGCIADAGQLISRLTQPGAGANPRTAALVVEFYTLRARAWAMFGDFQATAADAEAALQVLERAQPEQAAALRPVAMTMAAMAGAFMGQAQAAREAHEALIPLRGGDRNAVGMALVRGAIAVAERKWDEAVREFEAEQAVERSAYRALAERCVAIVATLRR